MGNKLEKYITSKIYACYIIWKTHLFIIYSIKFNFHPSANVTPPLFTTKLVSKRQPTIKILCMCDNVKIKISSICTMTLSMLWIYYLLLIVGLQSSPRFLPAMEWDYWKNLSAKFLPRLSFSDKEKLNIDLVRNKDWQ